MTNKQGFLATFRIDEKLWGDFRNIAKNNQTNASALLIGYIESVVAAGDTPKNNSASPQPCLDKNIDDTVKKLIDDALEDGVIGEKIDDCYQAMMMQLNELQSQIYALEQEMTSKIDNISEKCSSTSQSPVPSHQSPVTSHQSPVTSQQSPVPSPQSPDTSPQSPITEERKLEIIELLGIKEIVGGAVYYKQLLLDQGIDDRIKTNTKTLENLGITFNGNQRQPVARVNLILVRLGYVTKNIGQKTIGDTRGIECYQVQLP